jgi:hypothetical protein
MNHLEKLAVVGKILSNAAGALKGSQRHVLNSAEKARFLKSPGPAPHKVAPSRPSSAQWKADIAATKANQLKRYPPTAGPAGGPGVTGPPPPVAPFSRQTPLELRYAKNRSLSEAEASGRLKDTLGTIGLGSGVGVGGVAAERYGLFN